MKKIIALIFIVSVFFSCDNTDEQAIRALARRVVPGNASDFIFSCSPSDSDYFILSSKGKRVSIQGNNALSMAVGLNFYLRYYCDVDYGWLPSCGTPTLPDPLPVLDSAVFVKARVNNRFFLNYCTFGYTMPWWKWEEWERCIDWMALNGINLPLAITGQESIWQKLWIEMGLTDEEVRAYFTGPAHLPWHRMQNIDHWGGPLPQEWLDGQLKLQQKIVKRERELNMRPVLPAFSGHVPEGLMRLHPDAPIDTLGKWCGFPDECRCLFLDPLSDLYADIQKRFIQMEERAYGTDHIYGLDIFNEVDPPNWEPDFLAHISGKVYETVVAADPEAVWMQMSWMFFADRKKWTPEHVSAYIKAVPSEKLLLLDYFCERDEVWRRTNNFYGAPFIWCYLGNFGGNTFLAGPFEKINRLIEDTFVEGGSGFKGIGCTPEGFDCNPLMYEYVLEHAWDMPDRDWVAKYADRRLGYTNPKQREAWRLLCDSVYVWQSGSFYESIANSRPYIGKRSNHGHSDIHYSNNSLCMALGLMLEADGSGVDYEFDLVNLTRQWLGNLSSALFDDWTEAYNRKDNTMMDASARRMLELIDDMDRLAGTQLFFLTGKWIADARRWGTNPEEADYYERNARNIITTWSDAGKTNNDYAAREWNGFLSSYSKPRWETFFSAASKSLASGDDDWYTQWLSEVKTFERAWGEDLSIVFPSVPSGDPKTVARELYDKWCALSGK